MALVIDERLLDADGEMKITENFNRVMKAVDAASGGDIVPSQQKWTQNSFKKRNES